ncbi:hypothetical protein [Klebsiella spallanzanii]|uniref:hypothetical protein n=1 Tax=Klebsiella spallanzanii TaxID=2587528 RepID=UPI0025983799|nr:hypothetical protein [Klebsiella spallanzanii]MDM4208097.1 hypothetical protein [Klebsiella spallanzanii]
MKGKDFIFSTEDVNTYPEQQVLDTNLFGYEYVLIQKLLSHHLGIPKPIIGANSINNGFTVTISGDTFQIFEKKTRLERVKDQLRCISDQINIDFDEIFNLPDINQYSKPEYFPVYNFPKDACFVIRRDEIEKVMSLIGNKTNPESPPRISTPLSRLLWLACKHNEAISPLIKQPYKLISIFEQWASVEGITDRLSGDTLKTALERGSPNTSYKPLNH